MGRALSRLSCAGSTGGSLEGPHIDCGDLFGVPVFDFKGLPFAQRLAVHAGIGGMTTGLIRPHKEGVLTFLARRAFASSCGSRCVGDKLLAVPGTRDLFAISGLTLPGR